MYHALISCSYFRTALESGENRRVCVKTPTFCRLESDGGASRLNGSLLHGFLLMGCDLVATVSGEGSCCGFDVAWLMTASGCVVRGLGFDCDCGCGCDEIYFLAPRHELASRENGGSSRRMELMGAICRRKGVYSGLYCDRGGGDVGGLSLAVPGQGGNGTCCRGYDENDEGISIGPGLLSVDWIETCLDGRGVHQLLPWQHL